MLFIARQQRVQERQLKVKLLGPIVEGANIFRQAGAAKSESGLEIACGDVELAVGGENLDHRFRIDTEFLGQSSNLIGEGNLYRVPRVANILHHLSGPERGLKNAAWHPGVEIPQEATVSGVVRT